MTDPSREVLALAPIGDDPEVGRWLAALEDGRRDTLRELERVTPEMVDGQSLHAHRERLAGVRAFTLEHLKPMTNEDFHRVRSLDDYDVAPDWVLHHHLQHEAEHRSHIAWLRDSFTGS